jgi:hypothetical protein
MALNSTATLLTINLKTVAEAAEWLRAKGVEHYPDSEFTWKHARGFE